MPLTRKPSSSSSNVPTPLPHDAKVVRWSEPITGGDADAEEDRHRIDDDDLEAGGSPAQGDEENQQQLVIKTGSPEPKIDQRWAKSKLRTYSLSWRSRRMDDRPLRVRLYQAAQKGDWETAMEMEMEQPGVLTMVISERSETALHIATRAKKVDFVKRLVEALGEHELALKNNYGNTALCIAAALGDLDIAKFMVEKNRYLCIIRGSGNATPALIAARYKHEHMVFYLLSMTPVTALPIRDQMELLVCAISADYYDIALIILRWNTSLALKRDFNDDTALHIMARRSTVWQSNISSWFNKPYRKKRMQMQAREMVELMWKVILDEMPDDEMLTFIMSPTSFLHEAARVGNAEFLRLLINSYPDLAWKVDAGRRSIFHVAVENRQHNVFDLIYEMGEFLDYLPNYFDEEDNSLLELAAKMPNLNHLNQVSGAAFQMHRELIWFKEVEKIVALTMRRKKGSISPSEMFTSEHFLLVADGEKWMKKTANSCMLVATLIATVVFAAAFTVPGGYNNNNTGTPLFLYHKWFTVFVLSDAIALTSSSTSILLFLSILTSRCEEEDFLIWLPLKLVCGLVTLFFSVLTMVLAFSATFFLFYGKDTAYIASLVGGMAIFPVYCFCVLQFRLWADTIAALQATYNLYFGNRNGKAI